MAARTSKIPKGEWDIHKNTILELYCERGLPLTQGQSTKDGHECVDWIMRHQHSFAASRSQYEAQLRLWGATKNLKQSEWVSLLSDYNRLENQGKCVRIVISGQVQSRDKINKARHRYLKRGQIASSTASVAQPIASNRHSFVEVEEEGHWNRYMRDDSPESTDALVSNSSAPQHDQESQEEATSTPEDSISFSHQHSTLYQESAMVFQLVDTDMPTACKDSGDIITTNPSPPGYDINTFFTRGWSDSDWLDYVQGSITPNSPGLNTGSSFRSPQYVQVDTQHGNNSLPASMQGSDSNSWEIINISSSSSHSDPRDPPNALALLLQGKAHSEDVHHSASPLEVRGFADRFMCLLSDTSIFWNTRHSSMLVKSSSVSDPVLFNTLIYSIINGSAGLEDIPGASVVGVLRENRGFFSHISRLLRSGPDSVAKSIFDNLFPAAIRAGDAEAVALLLQATTSNQGISIDLNKYICHNDGGRYTPLELAVRSGSEEVIRMILEADADPNKKIANQPFQCDTALCLAVSQDHFKGDYPVLDVVQILLDHGAEISTYSVAQAIDGAGKNILPLQEMVQRLPASKHATCFSWPKHRDTAFSEDSMRIAPRYEHNTLVEDMVQLVENTVATSLVKELVETCMSINCKKCIVDHPEVINSMLLQAARRGNLELVAFLVQYSTSPHQALAGAVRSGNCQLITFLLENGARADGPAAYIQTGSFFYNAEPTTPLAEAIRRQDDELVNTLADYGAWQRINNSDHSEAVIIAAAEVGSIRFLEAVLRRVPSAAIPYGALERVVKRGFTEVALVLLRGDCPLTQIRHSTEGSALQIALQTRNKAIVDALLDCGAPFNDVPREKLPGMPEDPYTMELAGQWGDTEIIDDLVSLGANLDVGLHTTALAAAVASQNRQLVDHILDLGADPGAKALKGRSPLGEAVNNRDYSMIDHLLSRGATPADTSAFLAAMDYDQVALTKLCSAFKQRYPHGSRGFGTELIGRAILSNNEVEVKLLLDLKVDLKRLVQHPLLLGQKNNYISGQEHRISLLGFAVEHGKGDNIQLIDLLLRSGAPVNTIAANYPKLTSSMQSDRWYWTRSLQTPLLLAIKTRSKDMVNLLLEHGADINHTARRGVFHTPLQKACEIGIYDMVELLLSEGVDVNSPAARRYGGTALQMATKSGSSKIVELLLQNKADPHAPGSELDGGTTFELAAEYGRYHVLLLLWKTAPPAGFIAAILHSAKNRAEKNGHRGCVDFITNIICDASFERLISEGS